MHKRSILVGAAIAVTVRASLPVLLRAQLRSALKRLNTGDYEPLLDGFTDDAVLYFNEGPHRWSGPHVGRDGIERFLKNFVTARLEGEVGRVWMSGPPWALQICVRFDDKARAPDGEQIYANRAVLWARTRWGKVVEQHDFFEDTGRIRDLEAKLDELGVPAVG